MNQAIKRMLQHSKIFITLKKLTNLFLEKIDKIDLNYVRTGGCYLWFQ